MSQIESTDLLESTRRVRVWDALPFALPYLVFAILVNASIQGGWHIFIPFFFVVALGDFFFGLRTTNYDLVAPPRAAVFTHHLLMWLWCPTQIAVFIFVLWQILVESHLSTLEIVALTVIAGKSCLSSTGVGHELVHRHKLWERMFGELVLSSFLFAQYRTEHIYIHHPHVGTPFDPEFAPKGRSAWAFLPRAVFGSVVVSWRFERGRLRRRGVPSWHYTNAFWRYGGYTAFWLILVWSFGEAGPLGGWVGIAIYISYSIVANIILRLVAYVEHYGLSRTIQPNGRFERVEPRHSWNASHRISNWAAWNVQRHSDHHHKPIRTYPLLRHYDTDVAPQLPGNYTGMILVAMVPRLWYRFIDPLVDAWRQQFYPEMDNWRPYESKLYIAQPESLADMTEIMESPRLGDWIEAQPGLLDTLDRPEFENVSLPDDIGLEFEELEVARQGLVKLYYTRELDFGDLYPVTVDSDEPQHIKDVVDTAWEWMNAIVFQAGVHAMRGNLDPELFATTLSKVVDTVLDVILTSNAVKFGDDLLALQEVNYAIVAFGKLGRQRVGLDSTLELALIHDAADVDAESLEVIDLLTKRVFRSMNVLARENLVIKDVASPAAIGSSGSIAITDIDERFGNDAESCIALAEARTLCGDADLMRQFQDTQQRILSSLASSGSGRQHLAALRPQNGEPRTEENGLAPVRELDQVLGGFADLRLAAAYSAMLDAQHDPDSTITTLDNPFAAAAARNEMDETLASELGSIDMLWWKLETVLPFTASQRLSEDWQSPKLHQFVASSCGSESLDDLVHLAKESCAQATLHIDVLLGKA